MGSTASNPQRFPGQQFDPVTTLHYNYFRDYDPAIGRYLESDPIGLAGGMNTYAYSEDSPFTYVDRDGRDATIIVTRDHSFGNHAAMCINDNHCNNSNGFGNLLYDPAGTFNGECGKGEGRCVSGSDAPPLDEYIQFHQSVGSDMELYRFSTTPEQEGGIAENAAQASVVSGGCCSAAISSVLAGVGPFQNLGISIFSGNLAEALLASRGLTSAIPNIPQYNVPKQLKVMSTHV